MGNQSGLILVVGVIIWIGSIIVFVRSISKRTKRAGKSIISGLLIVISSALIGTAFPFGKEQAVESTEETESSSEKVAVNAELMLEKTDPLQAAADLVEMEVARQGGMKEWEITKNEVVSDNTFHNAGDRDKPIGDMRVVWVEGNLAFTTENNNEASEGFSLEFYQMRGDDYWYIGKHWGFLRHLEVSEKPNVVENPDYFSDSDELLFDEETGELASTPLPEYGEEENVFRNEHSDYLETDLLGAWSFGGMEHFYMIFRDDFTYSHFEFSVDVLSEGTYTIERNEDQFDVRMLDAADEQDTLMSVRVNEINRIEFTVDGMNWTEALRVPLDDTEELLSLSK